MTPIQRLASLALPVIGACATGCGQLEISDAPLTTEQDAYHDVLPGELACTAVLGAACIVAGAFIADRWLSRSSPYAARITPAETGILPHTTQLADAHYSLLPSNAMSDIYLSKPQWGLAAFSIDGGPSNKLRHLPENERREILNEDGGFFARVLRTDLLMCCDGGGASGDGALFTKDLLEHLRRHAINHMGAIRRNLKKETLIDLLANLNTRLIADEDKLKYGTVAMALIDREQDLAELIAVGDAVAMVVGTDGVIKAMTEIQNKLADEIVDGEHLPDVYYADQDLSTDDGFEILSAKFQITNALGSQYYSGPNLRTVVLEKGDRIIIVTDGVLNVVSPEEIAVLAIKYESGENISRALENLVRHRNAPGTHTVRIDGKDVFMTMGEHGGDNATAAIMLYE